MLVIILTAQRLAYRAHEDSYSTFFRVLSPLAHKLNIDEESWGESLERRRQRPVSVLLLRREQQQRKTSKHNHGRQKRERRLHSLFFTLHNLHIFPKSYDPDVLRNWQYGSDHLKYSLPRKRSATTNRAYIYFLRNFTHIFFISTARIRLSLTVPQLNGYDHLIFLVTRKQTNRQNFPNERRILHMLHIQRLIYKGLILTVQQRKKKTQTVPFNSKKIQSNPTGSL